MGLMYIAETGAMAVGTAMIGLFGTVALAAAQVANSVGGFLYMVPLGIAGAVTVRVAQAHGAGEGTRVRTIAGRQVEVELQLTIAMGGVGEIRVGLGRSSGGEQEQKPKLHTRFTST